MILRITKKGAEPALQIALKLYLMLLERFRGAHSFTPPLLRLHSLCHTRPCLKPCVMCSEQFRRSALLLNCSVQPFLSHSGLCNLQRIPALKWVDISGGLAHPLHPPSLAPELHTVVQSHHLWLGCCFLCLLSAECHCQAETVTPSAVPSAGRGSSPGPSLACPPECCEAAAVSLCSAAACQRVGIGRPCTASTTPLLNRRRAKDMMGNILNI